MYIFVPYLYQHCNRGTKTGLVPFFIALKLTLYYTLTLKAMKIWLRQKNISGNRQSLYLDFYPAIFNPNTGKKTRRDFLNLFIFDNPETPKQKTHNKNTLLKANNILQSKVQLLGKGKYEFTTDTSVSVSFNEVEQKNKDKDFLIDVLQQVRNIEKQILEQLK